MDKISTKSSKHNNCKKPNTKKKGVTNYLKRLIAPENFLLGIATIFIAIFTCKQIQISDDLANISENATRPYLVVDDIELRKFIIGKRAMVTFTVRNKGQTPAYNVVDSVRVDIMHPDTSLSMPPLNWTNKYIVGSEIKRFKQSQRILSKKDIAKIRSGKSEFYFWGKVSYVDITEAPHYTEFGYRYIFTHQDWFPHKEYNKAN